MLCMNERFNNKYHAATRIGTILVDHQLRILCFTPAVTHIINLILSDVGRPLAHIGSNLLGYNRLVEDTREVLDTLMLKELDVQTTKGRWYTIYITHYCTHDTLTEGAVITFVDMTEMKWTEAALHESELRLRTLIEQAPDSIGVPRNVTGLQFAVPFHLHTGTVVMDSNSCRARVGKRDVCPGDRFHHGSPIVDLKIVMGKRWEEHQ
ncbi:MAG TPA: PAS domain-containing protein [Desulfosporosinus sp.]